MTGCNSTFINCIWECSGDVDAMWYTHTHNGNNNTTNITCTIENNAFITENRIAIDMQVPWSTTYGGILVINNCYFASGDSIMLEGVNPSVVHGGGNSNVTITNQNSSTVYLH